MGEYLKNIDYDTLLKMIIEIPDYDDLVTIDNSRGNLLDNPIMKNNDDKLRQNFEGAKANGLVGDLWEQSDKGNTFRHIAVNRKFDGGNHLRLYMCPDDNYLYLIVNEILKRSFRENIAVYLKYSRENRYDKIVMYTHNPQELQIITELLKRIKNDHSEWFNNMKKSPTWLSEGKFKDSYIAPEKIVKRDYNIEYNSYTKAFEAMLSNIRTELLFYFKTNNIDDLKIVNKEELMKAFDYYFRREIGKMGLYLFYDANDKLSAYTNDLFPGFGESADEDFILTQNGLEIGKRVDQFNKVYYKIPFGKRIPTNLEEFKEFESYTIDDETMWKKKWYPNLFDDEHLGTGSSGIKR